MMKCITLSSPNYYDYISFSGGQVSFSSLQLSKTNSGILVGAFYRGLFHYIDDSYPKNGLGGAF